VVWIGLIWFMIGTSGRALVNMVIILGGSIKCWEVLEQLRDWQLLKKGSAL
jgi:hypothetical protein